MLHDTELIGTLTAGLVAAFVGGFVAQRLRIPPIVGYLLAGVMVGPATPGFEADISLAQQVAEIGVILLMFGVGIHFSVRELLAVRAVALPGAIGQTAIATGATTLLAMAWGWSFGEGLVLGLSISVASTVVLLRALEGLHALQSTEGRIAVGWLIVEDILTVLILVVLPILATPLGGESPGGGDDRLLVDLGLAVAKIIAFGAVIFFVAARAVPFLLMQVARTGSRELFTLAVLAGALGIAFGSAILFDVSIALGAFMAGLVVGQSALSHQAAADALPLRDSFAVLFFVSVGMLFDPEVFIDEPLRLSALVALIVVGKAAIAMVIVMALRFPVRTGLIVAAGLAQIGEFSFIVADVGQEFELLSEDGNNLVLGAALVSISINPLVFVAVGPLERWFSERSRLPRGSRGIGIEQVEGLAATRHAIVVGYGNVGRAVTDILARRFQVVVIERNPRAVEHVDPDVRVIIGDGANPLLLERLSLETCVVLIVAIPDAFATRLLVERARELRPNLDIIARAINEEEAARLREAGAGETIIAEREASLEIIRHALYRFGVDQRQALAIVQRLRRS